MGNHINLEANHVLLGILTVSGVLWDGLVAWCLCFVYVVRASSDLIKIGKYSVHVCVRACVHVCVCV